MKPHPGLPGMPRSSVLQHGYSPAANKLHQALDSIMCIRMVSHLSRYAKAGSYIFSYPVWQAFNPKQMHCKMKAKGVKLITSASGVL